MAHFRLFPGNDEFLDTCSTGHSPHTPEELDTKGLVRYDTAATYHQRKPPYPLPKPAPLLKQGL